jgi:hypothetical protein
MQALPAPKAFVTKEFITLLRFDNAKFNHQWA